MMRTSVAVGLATSAFFAATPAAHATSTDTPRGPSLTERGGADQFVDKAADFALNSLVGEANNDEDGLVGAVLPHKGDGLKLDASDRK